MRNLLRRLANWLASPKLAAILLLVLGVWSFLGTLVPQGDPTDPKVAAWAMAHAGTEPIISALGFHKAFSSPAFVLVVLLLAASTGVCSWRRTKVALRRYKLLGHVSDAEALKLVARPTFRVPVAAEATGEATGAAAGALGESGMRVSEREGFSVAASQPWVVFGSPVFHWALLLL
ncbi:MAG: cytochrome c biogenesis protein ResB, partial [Actinomycetes bacterium]